MEQATFDVFEMFATDPELEVKGAWLKQPGGSCELLIARHQNRAYGKMISDLFDQHREVLEAGGEASEKADEQIVIEVMAKTILLGWKNLVYKGKELPYSLDNARMVLSHRDFRTHVSRQATAQSNYKLKLEKEQGEA